MAGYWCVLRLWPASNDEHNGEADGYDQNRSAHRKTHVDNCMSHRSDRIKLHFYHNIFVRLGRNFVGVRSVENIFSLCAVLKMTLYSTGNFCTLYKFIIYIGITLHYIFTQTSGCRLRGPKSVHSGNGLLLLALRHLCHCRSVRHLAL